MKTEVGPTMTKQSMADECNINTIMKKYRKTGQLPAMIRKDPQYGDFSEVPSYLESLNIVHKAQEQFSGLPARIRREFDNNPAKFLEFCHDPKNGQKLVEMGLAVKNGGVELEEPEKSPSKGKRIQKETPRKDSGGSASGKESSPEGGQ